MNQGIFVRDAATGSPRLRTTADGPPVPPPSAAPAAGAAANPFGQFDLSSVIVGLINQGSRNPHETVKDTIEVAKLLAPAAAPGPDLDAIVERVVVRLGLQANGVRPEDPFTAYERIHGLLSRFSGGAVAPAAEGPNSAPPPPSGNLAVAAHLPAILSEVRMLIPEVGQMLRDLRAGRDAAPKAEQDMQSSRQQQQQPQTLEQRIEHMIRLGFQKMGEGVKGFDFAAYVCGFHPGGLEVYRFLEPQGAAGLIALAAMNPAARRLVNDPQIRPQLETFLLDFFTFDPSPASDGLSEADDPPAA